MCQRGQTPMAHFFQNVPLGSVPFGTFCNTFATLVSCAAMVCCVLLSQNQTLMKASKVLLALVPVLLCQCSRSSYRLADYKEYCDDELELHTTYLYEGNTLSSSIEISDRHFGGDSIVTIYETVMHDDGVDSIETVYEYSYGELKNVSRDIKSYDTDGIITKSTHYNLTESEWKEESCYLYDSKGRWIEYKLGNYSHSWSWYDSLDRHTGNRYLDNLPNTPLRIDSITYSADGRLAIYDQAYMFSDSIIRVYSKKLYKMDKHGRIISIQNVEPEKNIDERNYLHKTVYKYNRNGLVKRELSYLIEYPYTEERIHREIKYRYRHGLRTRAIEYVYNDGKKTLDEFKVYKYDFRHRLLLEEAVYYDRLRRDVDERKVWTYEK